MQVKHEVWDEETGDLIDTGEGIPTETQINDWMAESNYDKISINFYKE